MSLNDDKGLVLNRTAYFYSFFYSSLIKNFYWETCPSRSVISCSTSFYSAGIFIYGLWSSGVASQSYFYSKWD